MLKRYDYLYNYCKVPGIYQILNVKNGKCYVGQTRDLRHRLVYEHRRALVRGTHKNPYLQNAWNKYGEVAFEFRVITTCSKAYLSACEAYWGFYLKEEGSNKPAYNIDEFDGKMQVRSAEHNENIKKAFTEERKKALSTNMLGDKNHRYGKDISEKTRELLSVASKMRWENEDYRKKNINKNFSKGYKHSDESRNKISLSKIGKDNRCINFIEAAALYNNSKKIRVMGIAINDASNIRYYDCINDTEVDGFSPSKISQCCRGKRNKHKDFMWKKIEN